MDAHFSAEQARAFVRREKGGERGAAAMSAAERLAMSDHAATCAQCRALVRAAALAPEVTVDGTRRVFAGLLDAARGGENLEADDWESDLILPVRTPGELAELRAFEEHAAGFEPEHFAPGGTLGGGSGGAGRRPVGARQTHTTEGWWRQRWTAWQWAGVAAGLAAVAVVVTGLGLNHPGRGFGRAGSVAHGERPMGISDGPIRVSADGALEGGSLLPEDLRKAVLEAIRRGAAPGAQLGKLTRGGGAVSPIPINPEAELSPFFPPLFPVGTTVESVQPTLQWNGGVSDTFVEVIVEPTSGGDPIISEKLDGMRMEWLVAQPLVRGQFYRWRAKIGTAVAGDAASGAMFKVLSAEAHARLQALRQGPAGQSHLALGIAYAREGMHGAAHEEFEQLRNANARSPLAARLVDSDESWRTSAWWRLKSGDEVDKR